MEKGRKRRKGERGKREGEGAGERYKGTYREKREGEGQEKGR